MRSCLIYSEAVSKYSTLVNILDKLRLEAPRDFKIYHALPSETEKVDFARGRAFIHLFLKVRYGFNNCPMPRDLSGKLSYWLT